MTYIKVYWKHSFPEEPILLFSELDDNRNEIRKVEVYKNESMGHAWGDISRKGTFLSECKLPELNVINEDTQFEGTEIGKEEFEKVWEKAINGMNGNDKKKENYMNAAGGEFGDNEDT